MTATHFYPGQKVRCINDDDDYDLKKHPILHVREYLGGFVYLREVNGIYYRWRFAPLNEVETSPHLFSLSELEEAKSIIDSLTR